MVKMGTVWDRTAEFLTDNLTALVPVSLLAYFVPFSIRGNFAYASEGARLDFQLVLQLVALGFAVLAVWGSLTIIAMVFDSEPRSAGGVGARRLPAALLVSVLLLGVFLVLCAPVAWALTAFDFNLEAMMQGGQAAMPPVIEWPVALYLVVVLGVALWASARLLVLNPVIVAEKRMFGALARSWALTRGLTWPILGVILLYLLVSTVAVLATQMVFGSIFQLVAGEPTSAVSLSRVLTSVMVAAVQTGFTVIVPVFTAKLYQALTQREAAAAAA
jgi:hypothetical protein